MGWKHIPRALRHRKISLPCGSAIFILLHGPLYLIASSCTRGGLDSITGKNFLGKGCKAPGTGCSGQGMWHLGTGVGGDHGAGAGSWLDLMTFKGLFQPQ